MEDAIKNWMKSWMDVINTPHEPVEADLELYKDKKTGLYYLDIGNNPVSNYDCIILTNVHIKHWDNADDSNQTITFSYDKTVNW